MSELTKSDRELQRLSWQIYRKPGEEKYYPRMKVYDYLPKISGCPEITNQKFRPYRGHTFYSSQPILKIKKMPKYCHLRKLINYPFTKWGAPLITFVGNYGTGKSLMKNLLKAFFLARGVRLLEFNDRRFEARNLAPHGYFNKNGHFSPFEIDVFIPKDYQFRKEKPLWKYYDNVQPKYWTHYNDIVDSMKRRKLTVVYTECLTEQAKLLLWIDLMDALGENMEPNIVNMFSHHELARLIPENPTKEIYKLVRQAANTAMNLRKDKIGMITTFHIISEVFFRISQKFGYIIVKRPVNRQTMTQAERDARGYGIKECNISRGGYWMKHKIGYYPELPDIFRLIPQREKLTYPDFDIVKDESEKQILLDPIDMIIAVARAQGHSWREVAAHAELSVSSTYERGRKLGLVGEKK